MALLFFFLLILFYSACVIGFRYNLAFKGFDHTSEKVKNVYIKESLF